MNKHHVYPKKHRRIGEKYLETKMVKEKDHRAWHSLVGDKHPEQANRRIYALIFFNLEKTPVQNRALNTLMKGRDKKSCYQHCVDSFLPTGIDNLLSLSKIVN